MFPQNVLNFHFFLLFFTRKHWVRTTIGLVAYQLQAIIRTIHTYIPNNFTLAQLVLTLSVQINMVSFYVCIVGHYVLAICPEVLLIKPLRMRECVLRWKQLLNCSLPSGGNVASWQHRVSKLENLCCDVVNIKWIVRQRSTVTQWGVA